MRLFCILATLLALASPAWAQGVILNENFESYALGSLATANGWTRQDLWSGLADTTKVANTAGSPIHVPGTAGSPGSTQWLYQDHGGLSISSTESDTVLWRPLSGLCTTHTYQVTGWYAGGVTKNVKPLPSDLQFRWQVGLLPGSWDANSSSTIHSDSGSIRTASQTLMNTSGTDLSPPIENTTLITTTTNGTSFGWTSFTFSFTPTQSSYVLFLRVRLQHFGTNGGNYASRWDDIKVVDLTGTSMTVGSVSPSVVPASTSKQLTISGSGLNDATSLTLKNGSTQVTINKPFDSQADGQIKATFSIPASPLGKYQLILTGGPDASCPTTTFDNAVTVYSNATGPLINGDFETGDLTGWTKWGGDWLKNETYSSSTLWVTSPQVYGSYAYYTGNYLHAGGPCGIYQTVGLTPNQNYTLTFKWYVAADGGTHEVGVMPGAVTNTFDPNVALQVVQQTVPTSTWETRSFAFTAPQDGIVTFYVKASGNNSWVTKTDDMNLTTDGTTCADPFYVTNVQPNPFSARAFPVTQSFTINGGGFGTVDSVTLAGPATIAANPGFTQTSGQITATFSNLVAGTYSVVLTRPAVTNCYQARAGKQNALSVNCAIQTPITLVGPVGGWRIPRGGSSVSIALTGTHLVNGDAANPMLQSVKLVKQNGSLAQIPGTVNFATLTDTAGTATFDLTNAEAGRYDLAYILRIDTCLSVDNSKNVLDRAVLVYMPGFDSTTNNLSFETGYDGVSSGQACDLDAQGHRFQRPGPMHWDLLDEATLAVQGGPALAIVAGTLVRDSGQFLPECSAGGTIANMTGSHYGSLTNTLGTGLGAGKAMAMFQTIAAPSTATAMDYRADFRVQSNDKLATGMIVLLDGTEASTTVIAQSLPIADTTDSSKIPYSTGFVSSEDYKVTLPAGYTFTSSPPTLTILFVATNSTVAAEPVALHLDRVYRGGYAPANCNRPWADMNGDTYVDMEDFALMQACITQGMASPTISDSCRCADASGDGAITDTDVSSFLQCASGPHVPWSPTALCP